LAKPNYGFEKRQRDLRKKQKQEEKRQRRLAAKTAAKGGDEAPEDNRPDSGVPGDGSEPSSGT
jgi:hypothetical protein